MKIKTGEIVDKNKDKNVVSSVKLSKGTRVGTLKLTVNGEEQDSVPIRGLGGGSSTVIGGSVDTQALWDAINKKVDVDFFKNLFTVYDSSDIEIATNTYARKPDNLKISVGTWTEEYLSALGKNSEGGGGGGGVGTVTGIALGTDTTPIYPDDDTGIVTLPAYPTKVSQLVNDRGFVTSSTLNNYVTSSYLANNFYTKAQADNKYMTIAAFENLFNALDSNGDKIDHPYSSGVDSIKALVGLWTEQYLSALGQNGEGGGGGTGTVTAIEVAPNVYRDPDDDGIIHMIGDVVTSTERTKWNAAAANSHTHSNKAALDTIDASKIANWNNVATIMTPDGTPTISRWPEVVSFLSGYTTSDSLSSLLANKVDVRFFNSIFTVYDDNGNAIVPNTYTQVADNLKIMVGAWTEQYLSALGKNSEGSSGTGDVSHIKISSNPDVYLDPVDGVIDMSSYAATWNAKANRATTLAGYGITDAKITNGTTITLGNNSITPLTANSSLAWSKLTGTPTTLAGYGITDAKIANGVITLGSSTIAPVTSVGLSAPTGFSVSGSPVTKTGTLTFAYASGYEGFTTSLKEKIEALYSWFEVDANGDVKTKDTAGGHVRGFYTESFVSALGKNSQGESSTFDENQMWEALGTNATTKVIATSHIPDMASTYGYLKASALNGYATQTWVNQQGFVKSSGVTSVAMTVPTGLSVSGSPITSTGTFALTFANGYSIPTTAKQSNWDTAYGWGNHASAGYALASDVYSSSESRTANTVLAAPNGSAGAATFRALVAADIPSLAISKITDLQTTLDAKALKTTTITAGNGLTGGGDLSSNRTINVVSANAAITVNADNIKLNVINDYTTTTNNTIIPLAAARGKDLNDRLAVLESWFEEDADGNIKTKDMSNGTHRGFYTESFVSALGLNGESGGGTGDVSHIKIGTNPDVFLDPDEDGIIDMSSYAANWNDAYNKRHTHSNKSVLDGITSTKVSHWDAVYGVVPSAAYESGNSLADKNFVNSSISTSTATFRGTNTTATTESAFLTWANGLTHDLNDYVFWSTKDSAGNTIYKRYKYDGSQWVFEYDLNNSSFTSDQWSAINSGITSTHVSKLNGIAAGAQVNVIESVKVNGTALTVTSKAVDITSVPLTIITGADDLKAIEGLSGTGFLKRTGNNTWALDTTVVLSTRKVSTGNGLQGGGDLSADRTISILLPTNSGLSVASTGLKLDIVNNLTTASDYRAISATQAKKIWDLLNQMFTLEGAGTTASPYVIKANYGLYTNQFLSALGQNSEGGSGGGMGEDEMWAALQANTGTYENAKINWNHIPLATTSTAGAIKVGSTLAISNGILNQATIPNLTADVYTKVTVDTYGRVTQGGDLLADDIPTLSMSKISGLSTALGNVYTKTESDAKYITAIGTSGKYLTYTKNGNSNSFAVPWATEAYAAISANYIVYRDTRNVADTPTTAAAFNGVRLDFKSPTNGVGVGTWNGVLSLDPYSDVSGGYPIQLGFVSQPLDSDNTSKLYLRTPKSADTWNAWRTILDSSNTYVTNGKGYINGTEITTATKLGTATVGSSTTPIYLNGGVPTASTDKFIFSGDVLQTTNPFTPLKKLYISKIDNAFYAAEKRFTVTGEIIDGSTTTEIPQSTLHNLFDGSYETQLNITNNKTAKIHIRFDGYSGSAFPGYPYGYMFLSFYHVCKPTSVSARCYCNHEPQGIGWHDMSVVNYSGGNNASFLYRVRNDLYAIQEFEFTIVGDTTNSYGYTSLTQIEMNLDRPDSSRTPFLSKYAAETLYYPLTIESSLNVTEGVVLNNNKAIFFKDASGAGRNTLYFDTNNNLALGYGTAGAGYNTYIDGNNITLRYGINHATGLVLASNGNVRIPNTLSVDGTITNKYLAIAESWTDTWSDGTNTHPWYGIDGRWHNTGAYSTTISDYYGITLKTYNGNISIRNNGNVGIGTTDPSYKLHVNGYTSTTRLYLSSNVYLEYDSTNGGIHVVGAGLYSDSYVSALGANSSGGGGDASLNAVWGSLTTYNDEYKDEVIDVHHIPNLSWSKITSNKPTTLSGYGILDAYTKTQADAKYATISSLSDYLPLTGGTMMGILKWKDSNALPETTSPAYMLTIDSFASGGTTKWANLTNVTVGKATTATKLGTSTVGSSVRPIYLNNGTPTVANVETTYLVEPNYVDGTYDGVTSTKMPLFNTVRPNRFVLLPANQIIIEKTTDGGATWVDAGISNSGKINLFLGNAQNSSIAIPQINGERNKLCGIRITITGMKYNVPEGTPETQKYNYWNVNYVASTERYCSISSLYFWVSAVNDRIRTAVYAATGAAPNNWVRADYADSYLNGWSGGDTIKINNSRRFGGGTNQTTNYWNWRIEFFTDGLNGADLQPTSTSYVQAIHRIQGYGASGWTVPNNLMAIDHLYTWDESLTAIFPSAIRPQTNGANSLGHASYRWNTVYSSALNLNGAITGATTGAFSSNVTIGGTLGVSGNTTVGNFMTVSATNSRLILNKPQEASDWTALRLSKNGGWSGNNVNTKTYIEFTDATADSHVVASIGASFDGIGYLTFGNFYKNGYAASGEVLRIDANKVSIPSGKTLKIGDCTIEWDSTNQMLKFDKGIYSTGAVSALGSNNEGGGSSDFSEELMWAALQSNTGTYANAKIDANHIPDTSSLYGYLKSSSLSSYVNAVSTSGSGNAVTSVTKSGNTITFTKGSTFLTSHQTLYTLSIYGGTTKVLDFKPNANASIYIKAGGDISLTNDTTNKYITLSYTHPTNGANTTISAANGKVLSAITVNSLGHVTSVSSKTLAASDIPDLSSTYATDARADTLEGYFNTGGVAKVAAKLNTGTTTYTAWGQTYWQNGVPNSVSNTYMSGVTNIDSLLYFDTTNSRVGIGTSSPSSKLHVNGNTQEWSFHSYGSESSSSFSSFYAAHSNGSAGMWCGVTSTSSSSSHYVAQFRNGITSEGSGGNVVLQVAASGNVGIGIESPSYKLHVNGYTSTTRLYLSSSVYLEYDSSNNGVHLVGAGFYSDSYVSALGSNSSGGGSGTFDEEAMWTALGTTSTAKVIASSHIPNLNASKITSGTLADARIPSLAASKITSGTFDTARIPNLSADKITSGTFAAARIPDLSGRYYALYGGTPLYATSSSHYDLDTLTDVGSYYCTTNVIAQYFDNKPTNDNWAFRVWVSAPTGTSSSYVRQRFQYYNRPYIYERVSVSDDGISWGSWYLVQDNLGSYALASDYLPLTGGTLTGGLSIKFDTDSSRAMGYNWLNTSGTNVASIIYHNTAQNIILNSIGSSNTWNDAVGKYSLIVGNNSLTYNTYPILHSNNYSSYALPLTGGTLTGSLTIPANKYNYTTDAAYGLNMNNSDLIGVNGIFTNDIAENWAEGINFKRSNGKWDSLWVNDGVFGFAHDSGTTNVNIWSRGAGIANGVQIVGSQYTISFEIGSGNVNRGIYDYTSSIAKWLIYFNASNTILNFGNIGIGNASPTYKLDVTGQGRFNHSTYDALYLTRSNGAYSTGICFNNSTDGLIGSLSVYGSGNSAGDDYDGVGTLRYKPKGGSKDFAVMHAGLTKFSTAVSNGSYGAMDTRGSTYCYLQSGYTAGWANGMYVVNSSGDTLGSAVGVFGTGNAISRYYYGGTWNNPLMTILPNGNVGIGVNMYEPPSKLAVDGTITCRSNYFSNTNPSLGQLNVGTSAFKGTTNRGTTAVFGCYIWTDTNSGATKFQGGYDSNYSTNTLPLIFQPLGGKVRIGGNTSPTQALDVTGNILASGEVTASSDERLKTIVGDGNLDLRYIANAPNILFKWNNGQDDKVHGGSLAQYFLTGAKHFVLGNDKDYYSLNYGALATSMAISIAKSVVKHEDEITRLKKEVVKLRERVAELEERRIA